MGDRDRKETKSSKRQMKDEQRKERKRKGKIEEGGRERKRF